MSQKLFERVEWPFVELQSEMIDGERYYFTPTGNKYRSVTTVLSSINKQKIVEWRKRVGEEEATKVTTRATRRGTNVHSIAEKYLKNDAEYLKDSNPLAISMFKQIQPLIDENLTKVYGNEMPLYSDVLKTAGRCDCFGQFQGMHTIVDFKTSTKTKRKEWIENYFLQCTTYAMMIEERYDCYVPQLAIIIAVEEDNPQLFVERTSNYRDKVLEIFSL